METKNKKKEIIDFFLNKNLLISNEFVEHILKKPENDLNDLTENISYGPITVVDNSLLKIKEKKPNMKEFNRLKVLKEKDKDKEFFDKFIESLLIIKENEQIKQIKDELIS